VERVHVENITVGRIELSIRSWRHRLLVHARLTQLLLLSVLGVGLVWPVIHMHMVDKLFAHYWCEIAGMRRHGWSLEKPFWIRALLIVDNWIKSSVIHVVWGAELLGKRRTELRLVLDGVGWRVIILLSFNLVDSDGFISAVFHFLCRLSVNYQMISLLQVSH